MNRIQNPGGLPIDPSLGRTRPITEGARRPQATQRKGPSAFSEILDREVRRGEVLKFSAHAQNRLAARGISLSTEAVDRLSDAVDRAASKGARDALLLMPGASRGEDLALVVSVTNRTVVTAVDGDSLRENVFTNIDSAVIVGAEGRGASSTI